MTGRELSVLHIVEAFSTKEGGLPSSVTQIISACHKVGIEGRVLATQICDGANGALEAERHLPLAKGRFQRRIWVPDLAVALREEFARTNGTVVHIHGVWTASQRIAAVTAQRLGVPVVLSPHNMLNPALRRRQSTLQQLLKWAYWHTLAARAFRGMSAVHAITEDEAQMVAGLITGTPCTVIPNSIDLETVSLALNGPPAKPRRLVLALGRLVSTKGFDRLVHAFAAVARGTGWRLLIAGPAEDRRFAKELASLAQSLGLGNQFELSDSIYAPEKYRLMRDAWIVAVPSESEVIGMVNLEAGACYTPTIASSTCGLGDWRQSGGLLCEPTTPSVRDALAEALRWTLDDRIARGAKARAWVERNYSSQVVVGRWVQFYASIRSRHEACIDNGMR